VSLRRLFTSLLFSLLLSSLELQKSMSLKYEPASEQRRGDVQQPLHPQDLPRVSTALHQRELAGGVSPLLDP